MLHVLALLAVTSAAAVQPIVSSDWLQAHLSDPQVRVIYVGDAGDYKKAHIPGARVLDHMATARMDARGHVMAPPDVLAGVLAAAGAADGAHVILYGDTPMATAWVNTALRIIGHGDEVSWLDGGFPTWQAEHRPVESAAPPAGTGPLSIRSSPSFIVDAPWLRGRLTSPDTKILDVRSQGEWNDGHLPNATLILWQDLFADRKMQKFKSPADIRAVLAKAGVGPHQEVVTYCAIGMRASLMGWAAGVAGVPAKIYLGSWEDWIRDPQNRIVKP
jgi:thiosulfate/3-mercaptopyruvate sulfurtransferase